VATTRAREARSFALFSALGMAAAASSANSASRSSVPAGSGSPDVLEIDDERRPMYAAGAAWLFVTAYPAFLLAGSGSVVGALVGQMLIAVGVAIYSSALLVGLVELFPTALRCRGHGISYNVAVAVFGGTTPFIAAALVAATGSPVAPAFSAMAMIGTIGLPGILLVPETRNVTLRTSIYGDPEVTAAGR
jgi:MHS family proline/betaine transporter-like MFS transporter